MESERRRRQILHRQARDLVYKVFSYFKREADAICISLSAPPVSVHVGRYQVICVNHEVRRSVS
jgi:hypothetical protein